MKKLFLYIVFIASSFAVAQEGVGIGTTVIDPSAALDVVSTRGGLLISRVALVDITNTTSPINNPAAGLLVYNTNAAVLGGAGVGFYSFNGVWTKVGNDSGWSKTGDDLTLAGTNFLGTIDAQDLVIKTDATEAIRVESDGKIGIGTNSPSAKLEVEGTSIPAIVYSMDFEGSLDSVSTDNMQGNGEWALTSALPRECDAACTSKIFAINGSNEIDVLTLGPFTPLQNAIDISFVYGWKKTGGSSSLKVELWDILLDVQVGLDLINLTGSASNITFPPTNRNVTIGRSYELRVTFQGSTSAAVDNFLVEQEPIGSPILRIQDGGEKDGYILTSDADGFARWRNPKVTFSENDWSFLSGSTNNDPIYHEGLVRGGSTTVATKTLDLDYSVNGYFEGATTFGVGSVEYFADFAGFDEITAVNNHIGPQVDNTVTLGDSDHRWSTVYLAGSVITTSDRSLKENINPIPYGIQDVMKLKPSQYFWKDEQFAKGAVPLDQKRLKLGLIAQELLEVIPEVVVTHQWVKKSEEENKTFVLKENEILGVNYAELLPVLVKATQEQQVLIEKLKLENKRLEKLILK